MRNLYVVRALPVRDERGDVAGWVRVDPLSDGTLASDLVFLRDGSAWGQADAMECVTKNPALLYRTRDEAVRDGLNRLRGASRA